MFFPFSVTLDDATDDDNAADGVDDDETAVVFWSRLCLFFRMLLPLLEAPEAVIALEVIEDEVAEVVVDV